MTYKLPDCLSDASRKEIEFKIANYEKALAGNVDAIIWYLKNVAGWED